MLPKEDHKHGLDELAKRYFVDELGLPPEAVSEAAQNLVGVFDALLRIDQRLKQTQTPQPL
ncbi:MAG: hypothetical protein NUV81_03745 [bacterium]|nr:hypothetical protein [bacterium]